MASAFALKIGFMPHRLRALVLLAALLWQSLGMLGAFSVSQRAGELKHLAVHAQEVVHHHYANHTLHIDMDESATQHFHADTGTGWNSLLASALPNLFDASSANLPDFSATLWLSPSLERPLRPSQHIA